MQFTSWRAPFLHQAFLTTLSHAVALRFAARFLVVLLGLFGLNACGKAYTDYSGRKFPSAGQFVEVNGQRIHYVSHGAGAPVIFIHGSVGTVHDFLESPLFSLVAEKYQAIAYDRSGFGYSSRNPHERMTPADHAAVLARLMAALRIEKPIVVGHSWGGAVALAFALKYPHLARGVVLLAPVAYGSGSWDSIRYWPVRLPILGTLFRETFFVPVAWLLVPHFLSESFYPTTVPASYLAIFTSFALRPSHYLSEARDMPGLGYALAEMSKKYAQIKAPVTVICGDQDQNTPCSVHARPLHRAIPNARLVIVAAAGHQIHFSQSRQVYEEITRLAAAGNTK